MTVERCINQNHSKINVSVRFCSACGEIVNQKIPKQSCSNEQHAKSRKDRNTFCFGCGINLKTSP